MGRIPRVSQRRIDKRDRYSNARKLRWVCRYLDAKKEFELTITEFAEEAGLAKESLREWVRAYRNKMQL